VVFLSFSGEEKWLKFCRKYVNGSVLFVVFFSEKFLVRRFSATDTKYVLKAFAMVSGLLDNLLTASVMKAQVISCDKKKIREPE
jgi:hypothetical protein